nr:Chain C, Octapeptide (MDWNMHAA) [synthetic construct]
MDWNMHAA